MRQRPFLMIPYHQECPWRQLWGQWQRCQPGRYPGFQTLQPTNTSITVIHNIYYICTPNGLTTRYNTAIWTASSHDRDDQIGSLRVGRVADLALLRLGEGEEEVVFTSACFGHRLRDGWPHENGWIFGKVPNGLWTPPHFRKIMLQIFSPKIMLKNPCYV